ncbi:transcription factor sef1 [Colletotrichum asianum]
MCEQTSDSIPWIDGEIPTTQSFFDLFLEVLDKSPRLDYECPVFRRVFGPDTLEKVHTGDYAPERIGEDGMENAVRRRIYIPNPSPTALGVLALRSSYEQKQVIRQLLFDYLDSSTSVGLKSSEGDDFILEFHMPCLIWQKGLSKKDDLGRTTNTDALRKTIDLSFLATSVKHSQDGGQTLDETDYFWTAICLVDSYFKSQTDAEDPYMLPHYARDPDDDDPDLDPLSIGKLTADKVAAVDPREYFLLIIKVRIMRLREIWMNVVYHLGQRINQYVSWYLHD